MDTPSKRRKLTVDVMPHQGPPPATAAPQPPSLASAPAAAPAPTVSSSYPAPLPPTVLQKTQYSPEQPRQQHPQSPPPSSEGHEFELFARHLQDAAMYICSKMERHSRYKNVSVLLLQWEDDVAMEGELFGLDEIFRERYNYHTEKWSIPRVPNPIIKLSMKMAPLIEHARDDHLLIIYYAGHSYLGPGKQLYWASNAREDACRLKWGGVRYLLEDAQCDILLLLDTMALHDSEQAGQHGTKQAIVACSPGQKGSEYPTRSFSTYLSESLYNLSTGRPYSVQSLHEEILRLRRSDISDMPVDGRGARPTPPERSPTLFTLTPGKHQPLVLAPLQQRGSQAQEHPTLADRNGPMQNERIPFVSTPVTDLTFDEARVLVCTTFIGDASPDLAFYNQWLQNTPPLASKITMEGMFLGPPTMLLVSIPLSVWNVFQHDKVCCFLGYINSHNMIDLYKGLVKSTAIPRGPSTPADPPNSSVMGGPVGSAMPVYPRAMEDGRVLLEASQIAANSPILKRRHESLAQQASTYSEHTNHHFTPARKPLPNSAPLTNRMAAISRDNGEEQTRR